MQPQANPNPSRRNGLFSLVISIFLIIVALWTIGNRQLIVDNLSVWQNQPTAEVEQLAERSNMSEAGKFLFYASVPEVSDREVFIDQCGTSSEKTAVLGCYKNQKIYIFDVDDPQLDGIREVTAAHEMLHAAYDRMSKGEKSQIDNLVQTAYEQIEDNRLDDLVKYYDEAEPGHRHNELYAILGTEYTNLPSELEEHYKKYFNDRSAVVSLAQSYQHTFDDLALKQQAIIDELNKLAPQIESATEIYNREASQLASDIGKFNQRADQGRFASQFEFNSERSALVSKQSSLQAEQDRIQSMIDRYENQRRELEEVNLAVEGLNHSINANLSETPTL